MSLRRYQEIKEAEVAGKPLDLSDDEKGSYQQAEEAMKAVGKVAQQAAGRVTEPIAKRLRESLFKSVDFGSSVRAVTEQQAKVDVLRPAAPPALPTQDYDHLAASVEAGRIERERLEEEERELQRRQTSALEAMAEGAETAGKLQTRFNWAILVATIIGVLVGAAALLVTIFS
jgi:hypothetical protein